MKKGVHFLRVIRRNFHNEVKGKGKIASHNVTQDDASVFRERKRVKKRREEREGVLSLGQPNLIEVVI